MSCGHADVRRLALALPEAYEDTHRGRPAFRVRKKIFAMLNAPRPGGAGEGFFSPLQGERPVVGLKLDREDQLNFIAAYPEIVGESPDYGHHGWTHVRLEAVAPDLLETLVRLAWANIAPKRLSRSSARA
jgi:hypothetical protein